MTSSALPGEHPWPTGEFDRAFMAALRWLWPAEGGWYDGSQAFDTNPTNFGITQKTFNDWRDGHRRPRQSVREITRIEAQAIYFQGYWKAGACPALSWPLALVHFDACVNHGLGNAMWLVAHAINPWHYIALREGFYNRIVQRNPVKRPALRGWMNRMRDLRAYCTKHPEVDR